VVSTDWIRRERQTKPIGFGTQSFVKFDFRSSPRPLLNRKRTRFSWFRVPGRRERLGIGLDVCTGSTRVFRGPGIGWKDDPEFDGLDGWEPGLVFIAEDDVVLVLARRKPFE
jgi:hypothetical protein